MRVRDERGTGVIGTTFGAVVFLAFLSLATHVLIGLYATSVVSSVAWDEAQLIATHPDDQLQVDAATANAQQRLHGFKHVQVNVSESGTDVYFALGVDRPSLLPKGLARASSLTRIQRTSDARIERLQ